MRLVLHPLEHHPARERQLALASRRLAWKGWVISMTVSSDDIPADLPEHEAGPLRDDLPIVQEWATSVHGSVPRVSIDRRRFDAGQGHVLLVITVRADPGPVREELVPRLSHPDRLRVRRARPSDDDLRRAMQWVIDEHMTHTEGSYVTGVGIDEPAGVVRVQLNRPDRELAAQLENHEAFLIHVDDTPSLPVAPELERSDLRNPPDA